MSSPGQTASLPAQGAVPSGCEHRKRPIRPLLLGSITLPRNAHFADLPAVAGPKSGSIPPTHRSAE
jgi:hypothetical protein